MPLVRISLILPITATIHITGNTNITIHRTSSLSITIAATMTLNIDPSLTITQYYPPWCYNVDRMRNNNNITLRTSDDIGKYSGNFKKWWCYHTSTIANSYTSPSNITITIHTTNTNTSYTTDNNTTQTSTNTNATTTTYVDTSTTKKIICMVLILQLTS